MNVAELSERIERIADTPAGEPLPTDAATAVDELLDALERGEVRAASRVGDEWHAVPWVKRGILLGFRVGKLRHNPRTYFIPIVALGGRVEDLRGIPLLLRPVVPRLLLAQVDRFLSGASHDGGHL